jgi:outer membrane lipoprotein-sorting protein
MWIDQERFVPLQTDMFSKSGKLLKRIKFDNVQRVQNRWFPTTMHYKDMLKEGKGTTIRLTDIQLNATIPASTFNKANLR